MHNKSESAAPKSAELLAELRTLVSEAEGLMSDSVSDLTSDAVEALRVRFKDAQQRLSSAYAAAKRQVVAGAHYTDDAIRTHPYQSLGVAVGAGVLVGLLIGRRCCR